MHIPQTVPEMGLRVSCRVFGVYFSEDRLPRRVRKSGAIALIAALWPTAVVQIASRMIESSPRGSAGNQINVLRCAPSALQHRSGAIIAVKDRRSVAGAVQGRSTDASLA